MKRNFKYCFIFVFAMLILGTTNVYAVSNLTITEKSYVGINFSDGTHRNEAYFNTNKGVAYCITPSKTGGPQGTSLSYSSTVNSGPVLYLLNNASNSKNDYLVTQLAIWKVNNNYIPKVYNKDANIVNNAIKLANTAKSNSNYAVNPTMKLSSSRLNFSESSDGNYYISNYITVNTNKMNKVTARVSGAKGATITSNGKRGSSLSLKNGNKFNVKIPKSSITSATNIKVTVKATGTKASYERYYGGKWQDLVVLVKKPKTVNSVASGTVKPVVHKCEYKYGKYYDKNGKVTSKTNYSIQCDFAQSNIDFNGVGIDIKCLIAWNVAIRPCELEKLARICGYDIVVKSDNKYYKALMKFLSRTGMNLLDILLADNEEYEIYIQQIELSKKTELKDTFDKIREIIIKEKPGSNILRYIVAYLKNDVIRDQLADRTNNRLSYLYLKNEAIPFDEMPYASSLCGHNLSKLRLHKCLEIYDCEYQYVSSMVNKEAYDSNILYVIVDHDKLDYYQYEVDIFNHNLYNSKKQQLRKIDIFVNHLYVKNYYETTKSVIEKLQKYTLEGIDVYSDMIDKQTGFMQEIDDDNKRRIVANIYMNSKLGMIYGAAGTGKTRVAEYIAKIFEDKNILLLANTNAAKNNLERRIKSSCDCYTVYDYLKNVYSWKKYDLVILDECSTVCNEDVLNLFEKCNAEAYLLIGDIYQIEAIKFGNWFNFARYFVDKKSVYELVTPYRAKDKSILLDMWTCVRNFDENMFERLLANGFISTLNESIFERDDDEIVLCLGYDGLYGVNNINRYMQKINPSKPIEWGNWTYKVGDKVLFNESRRFGNVLYNNLKGSILSIDKKTDEIVFQILVDKIISERDVLFSDIKLIDCDCEGKSIVEFSVKRRVERDSDSDYSEQIVPFQIAYAVSIHKAQGLEYKSVKVVITEDIDEKISHNIFYTAITRTTDKLKIYMSKETQKKLAEKFVKSNVGLKQAQLFAGQAGLKLKNKLSS